jgi:hypothetical protein
MDNPLHSALFGAVRALLRPLATILIRNGIAYGTFAELAKKVYVDVAFEEFAEPGKKQTISRVSALTGLFRKEAKRLHELPSAGGAGAAERYNRAIRVISGWLNDAKYQTEAGAPADLVIEGSDQSFAMLVREYSGDIPTQAMLKVLKAAGSVVDTDTGRVRLVSHAFIPSSDPIDKLHILGTDVAELVATIDHNLTAEPGLLFFQRKVSNSAVRADAVPAFRSLSAEKAQALLEELDAWLSRHEVPHITDDESDGQYVSLGIYYSEHQGSKEK